MSGFTDIMRKTADPLFKKELLINESRHDKNAKTNKWFDHECYNIKEIYKNALRLYSLSATYENKKTLADKKRLYKKNIIMKKRKHKYEETKKLVHLRKSNPRAFWQHFKPKRKTETSISPDDFNSYFSVYSILFPLFIEDLELFLQDRNNCGLTLDDINLILLLLADDMVLLSYNPQDL